MFFTLQPAPGAPPQQVTVLTVGSHNSTSISVSWDPPPTDQQNGIIQEYKIWCLANETRFHVNKSVDATIRSVVVGGLQAGVQYRVEVAAGTSAGVGVKSKPQLIILVQSFTFTRAVTFQRDRGLIRNGRQCTSVADLPEAVHDSQFKIRPGLLKAGDPGLPWLADSWPSTSLPANGGLGSPKGGSNFGRGDVLPSAAVDKTGTMLSDGAIYSSIDFMGKAGYSSPARGSQPTPYATTQILQSNSFHELAVDRPDPRWKASLQAQQEIANLGYSLTDRRPGSGAKVGKKKKVKGGTKASKSNGTCWANMPLPPPPMHPLPGTEVDLDRYPQESHGGGYDSNSWAPPMSVQTYRHQNLDNEAHLDELTRAYQYEVAKQAWHMKSSPNVSNTTIPPMDFMSSTLGSDLGATLLSEEDEEEDERYAVVSKNLCGFEYTPGHSADNLECSGKSSQQCHSDSSGTADHGAQGTHSLGHKRAPMTGLKPQADKVGTRRRDEGTPTQTGHPEQGIPQETWHRSLPQRASSHKQHREKGTLVFV
ncbi:Roundabout-like protein 2 Precursor [Larimichthys crocea]|uniref:Roundabout-like protein 2 n=1 Tax=Larimichthys crocea TaxID=215358 RepID=A0A6G0HE87_LARCR|nr:Roundabout-like protein 2 Precursor [Larimichthys crocea]